MPILHPILRLRRTALILACGAAALVGARAPLSAQTVSAPLTVTTLAGTAGERQATNGTGTAARFYSPAGIAIDSGGNLIIADTSNNIFRKITPGAVVSTFSGSPIDPTIRPINIGSSDGAAADASFHIGEFISTGSTYDEPIYTIVGSNTLGLDASGNIYLADTLSNTIRRISPAGAVTTIAGSANNQGSEDGPGASARFLVPAGVAVDSAGNVYVADSGNNTIRKVAAADGTVSTLAGTARTSGITDGTGSAARFSNPSGVAIDAAGNLYVTDTGNHTIRKITPSGVVSTVAGSARQSGTADGSGTTARFNAPTAIALDSDGNIYVADTGNHAIRKISTSGAVTTIAGTKGTSGSADGTGSDARFKQPYGIAVDSSGAVYIADAGNNTIRRAVAATSSGSLQITGVPPSIIQVTETANVTLKIAASGTPAPTYQWSKNGVAIAGATESTLVLSSVALSHAGNYSVQVASNLVTYSSAPTQLQVFALGTPVPSVTLVTVPPDRTVAAGQSTTFTVEASSAQPMSYQWTKNGVAIPGATSAGYTVGSAQTSDAAVYAVTITDSGGSVSTSGATLVVTGSTPATAPTITTQPASVTVALNASTTLTVAVAGNPSPTLQWQKDGIALSNGGTISGATTATLTITGVTAADAGSYTVVATNSAGSVTSTAAVVTVGSTPPPAGRGRIVNMSVLTSINAGEDFSFGYYIGGEGTTGTKPILMRAMGPSLEAIGVGGVLSDPKIEFYNGSTLAEQNDNWGGSTTLTNVANSVGAFPFSSDTSKDAAIYSPDVSKESGHSIKISGAAGTSGTVIAELYDITPASSYTATTPRLINVSLLKNVGTMTTMGFFIDGPTSVRVLVRAVGARLALAPFNIPGTMGDPKMALYPLGADTPVATNDNWVSSTEMTEAIGRTGAFGLDVGSNDSAMIQTLAPGGYTVQVSAATGATGIALIEVYELP